MFGKVYFESLADFYSHDVQSSVEERTSSLITWDVNSSKHTGLFRCLLTPGMKTSPHTMTGKTQPSNKAFFFSRWILTENCPCPESLEVEALGSK